MVGRLRRLLRIWALAAACGLLGACSSSNGVGPMDGGGTDSASSSSSGASGSGEGGTAQSSSGSSNDGSESGDAREDTGAYDATAEAGSMQDGGTEDGGDAGEGGYVATLDAESLEGSGPEGGGDAEAGVHDATADVGSLEDGGPEAALNGSEVAFSVHCCSAPPNPSNLVGSVATAIIGPGIEFPAISSQGASVIDANVDVSGNAINIQYLSAAQAFGGAFNGYQFAFFNAADGGVQPPTIVGATLDPSSTLKGVTVTFDASDAFINVAGLSIPAQSTIIVDLAFASSNVMSDL